MSFRRCCCAGAPVGCASIKIQAFGCNGGVSPQTLTIKVTGNGLTYTSTSTPYTTPKLPSGTYTWEVTSPRFVTQSGQVTITCPQADRTIQVFLVAATGYVCTQGCDTPWQRTLNYTSTFYNISTTVTYNDATAQFEGTASVNVAACGADCGGNVLCQGGTATLEIGGRPGNMGETANPSTVGGCDTRGGVGPVGTPVLNCPPNGSATNQIQGNIYRINTPNGTPDCPGSAECVQGTSTMTVTETGGGMAPMVGPSLMAAPAQPTLATKAVNLGRAVVSHARAGFPSVDDATYNERLRVCEACPNLILPAWICGGPKGCGCNLKLKARWAEQKCPLAKWER